MRAYAILVPFFTVLIGGSIWVKTERDPDRYQRKAKSEAVRETELQAVRALLAIDDPESRARAIFGEVSKVFNHPRCANCHTADVPLQGETGSPHIDRWSRSSMAAREPQACSASPATGPRAI